MGSPLAWPRPTKAIRPRVVDHGTLEREVKLSVPCLAAVEARLQELQGIGAAFLGCVSKQTSGSLRPLTRPVPAVYLIRRSRDRNQPA